MNKLKMAAVQERLKLKRVQIDTWTTREKLCLASAVLRSGDQNWVSVSRTLRSFDDLSRPPDWFSQKNCALQYSSLLEKVDTPKRKRGERGEVHVETPGESIVRKLTSERVEELKKSIEMKRSLHKKLQEEITLVRSGQADDKLDDMLLEIEDEKRKKKREAEVHAQWLKEREEKLLEIRRAWKPPAAASSTSTTASSPHQQRDPESGNRRSSSQSEQSSEAESLVDSPLSEPLQVDVIGDESLEGQVETKPSSPVRESSPQPNSSLPPPPPASSSAPSTPTPTSPLLTSLLKSPSQAPSLQASSILHSAITAQRGSSPTITSLLNSSPGVPVIGSGAVSPSVSAGIKSLVTTAISSVASEDLTEKAQSVQPTTSPSAGAPTLSMLLEMPPSLPGKPLPEIPSLPPKVPSIAQTENASASPVPSPPASPQPPQDSLPIPSDAPVSAPVKEEETVKEVPAQPQEQNKMPEDQEKQSEIIPKVENESKEKVDDLVEETSEKPDVVTPVPVLETTTETTSQPETTSVEETNPPPVLKSDIDIKEEPEELEDSTNKLESVEESIEKPDAATAPEVESTSDKKSLTDVPHTKFPEHKEVPEVSVSETKAEEESKETPTVDKHISSDEGVEENVSNEVAPLKEIPKVIEESQITTTTEENVQTPEIKAEKPPAKEVEKKAVIEEIPEKTAEAIGDVEKEEQQPSTAVESKPVDETSLPEPTPAVRKDEVVPPAAEEEEIADKSPSVENQQSNSESLTPESQLRKRGGGRGRKSRRRALALCRMHQERKAREKVEKEKDEACKVQDCDSENSVKETTVTPVNVVEDVVKEDKTETKKGSIVDDEISNLKSEWDEDAVDDGVEDEKKEKGTIHKKTKAKKMDEASDESKQKVDAVQIVEKPEIETVAKVGEETKKTLGNKTEKDANVSEECRDHEVSKANEGEKPLVEAKDQRDKKTDAKIEDELPKKVLELNKEEGEVTETEPSTEKKSTVERKSEDKKLLDKKAESKGKQISSDKKLDDKERKKLKDNKVEKKDKKVEGEKKVEEIVVREEEKSAVREEEKKLGKEKKMESKDRKSLSEKRIEVGDKKQVREKKSEEKEEKGDGEKRILEKGTKELELKKADGERKLSRERKPEEKDKKGTEKKVEEIKRKSVDEKKTEEAERFKSSEKEMVMPSKKGVSASISEKSKPLVVAASIGAMTEKLKRKFESAEEDLNVSSKIGPSDAKQAKRSEEGPNVCVSESDKETKESERKMEEESAAKRKIERRKGILSKRLDMEEGVSRTGPINVPAEDREKSSEGDSTPKSNIGRRRGVGSMSISSTPGTPLDQIPSSPASSQSLSEEERDYRAWKKAILLVWSRLATHKFASIFLRPITNDQAPGYHNVVFRPVDLHTIKKNVENGVIRTTAHFQRDVMLMFLNAIMYNSSDHDVHRMSVQMQQEGLQHIQILLEASEAPKILRRETREGNKRSDSSSQMHFTPSASHDEASTSAGVTASASSTHTPAAENAPIVTSEEELSESESHLSYIISRQKVGDSGDFSGGGPATTPTQFHKDILGETDTCKKMKLGQDDFLELNENHDAAIDVASSAENSNSSDNEDEKMDEVVYMPKKDVIKQVKDGKQPSGASFGLDQCPDTDLGEDQLSSSQFGDHEPYVDEMEKKQIRRLKRSMNNECSMSSEDSCSIPDDGGYWPNVMSIKGEKADDTESVSSSVYKRRRVQRKSTNSDPDSLTEAPNFHFSSNSASLEESDYQAWKRLVLLIWDQLADHDFATIFMTPVRTDEAPRYYNVVYRPMDLGTIRKNVEKGLVRTISHFQRDVMLMFANALMYNPSHHDVHHKTAQMQKECLQYLQVLVQESSEDPEVFRHEIREANNKIHSTGLDDVMTVASKSDSSSSEDQLSCILTSGKVSVTADSDKSPSLKGSLSILNEKDERNSVGKKPAINSLPSPAFSTRKRTLTYDSV